MAVALEIFLYSSSFIPALSRQELSAIIPYFTTSVGNQEKKHTFFHLLFSSNFCPFIPDSNAHVTNHPRYKSIVASFVFIIFLFSSMAEE